MRGAATAIARRSARGGGSAARRRVRAHAPAEATSPSFRATSKNCSSPRPYAPRCTSGTRRSADAARNTDMVQHRLSSVSSSLEFSHQSDEENNFAIHYVR